MNELIKIKTRDINGNVDSVNARDLYEYLEIKRDFSNWIKEQLIDFIEDSDYSPNLANNTGERGQPRKDYIITLNVAKHIAMIQRNIKGREIRNYFIEYEKAGQQLKLALYDDPVIKMRLDQIDMEKRMQQTEKTVEQIQGKQDQLKTDPEYFAIIGYASWKNISIDLTTAQKLGKQAKRMCYESGYIVGSIPDPRFGRVHTYPAAVLDVVFHDYFKED